MDRVPYGTDEERAAAAERLESHLSNGGVVAYPTETVYGLGCGLNPKGLGRLSDFKGGRPFLLLIRDPAAADRLQWSDAARKLARRFWPGPLTLVLPDPGYAYPSQVRGDEGGVAVRVSPHPAVPALLATAGGAITSTSANRPGDPPALNAASAAEAARNIDDMLVLDGGALPESRPSTLVWCGTEVRLLREGAVARQDLEAVVDLR